MIYSFKDVFKKFIKSKRLFLSDILFKNPQWITAELSLFDSLSSYLLPACRRAVLHCLADTTTAEALLTDTLVSGQLYLRPPCLKPRFNSSRNSVFLHSHQ